MKYVPSHIPSDVYSILAKEMGLSEPKLVEILKGLKHYHDLSFKEECTEDRFSSLFGLDELEEMDMPKISPKDTNEVQVDYFDTADVMKAEDDADNAGLKSEDIQTVMEILACSRVEAINLLMQYGGNLDEALTFIFG